MHLNQTATNSEKAPPRIVSVGQTTIDNVSLDGAQSFTQIGGSAYLPSRIWAAWGIRVGLVSCLGSDLRSESLRMENLDLRGVREVPGPSTNISLQYSGQNLIALDVKAGVSQHLTMSQIPPDYFSASLFYVSPAPIEFILDLLEITASQGITVAFSPKEDFPSLVESRMRRVLFHCNFCFVNERELTVLADAPDDDAIEKIHDAGPDVVIVTRGARGVTVSSRTVGRFDMPVFKQIHTENPLGAGDCFAAAFLASSISGHSLHDSTVHALHSVERWLTQQSQSHLLEGRL